MSRHIRRHSLSTAVVASGLLITGLAGRADGQRAVAPTLSASEGRGTTLVPRSLTTDSTAHYVQLSRTQARTGLSLIVAGAVGVVATYVQYARSGRQGMSRGDVVGFAASNLALGVGAVHWHTSRELLARANGAGDAVVVAR